MKVEYITSMGDDLMVVNAARVSFDKESGWNYETSGTIVERVLAEKDVKLINYLANNGHWSPFSHPQIQVRITAPIFIANQLKRSTVGLAVNEVSRRYVDDEPTFYIPDKWRGRPEGSIKQGSSEEEINLMTFYGGDNGENTWEELPQETYSHLLTHCTRAYNSMVESGIAPEMARMVLPQSMNTSWIWTGSLLAFIRIYKQRIDKHSQLECQIIAQQIGEILKKRFPVSFEAWVGGDA